MLHRNKMEREHNNIKQLTQLFVCFIVGTVHTAESYTFKCAFATAIHVFQCVFVMSRSQMHFIFTELNSRLFPFHIFFIHVTVLALSLYRWWENWISWSGMACVVINTNNANCKSIGRMDSDSFRVLFFFVCFALIFNNKLRSCSTTMEKYETIFYDSIFFSSCMKWIMHLDVYWRNKNRINFFVF